MTAADSIHYHEMRAEQERARAGEASSAPAADAHRALAELHERRARALAQETPRRPKLHAAFG